MSTNDSNHLAGDYSGGSAKTYIDRRFGSSPRLQRLHQIEFDFIRSTVEQLPTDSVVLDVPCGSGRLSPALCKAGQVYSIDLSADMLKEAKENKPAEYNGDFILASAMSIPLRDKSVDLAVCMRLFHHIGDPDSRRQLFNELARVSRSRVVTSFYRTESYRYYKKRLFGKKISGQPVSSDCFRQEAQACGLRTIKMIPEKPGAWLNASYQTLVLLEVE